MTQTVLVSSEVLDWEERADSSILLGREYLAPYAYYRQAERLAENSTRHNLIDLISNLKRSVDHRIKQISSVYKIKKAPFFLNSVSETLVSLEVVRPFMLKEIITIRNAVEHQFADPPAHNRCLELIEVVWYFLKSTDQLAKRVSFGVSLCNPYNDIYYICYTGSPANEWKGEYRFRLPACMFIKCESTNIFAVELSKFTTWKDKKALLEAKGVSEKWMPDEGQDDDIVGTGKILDQKLCALFYRLYFRAN